MVTWHGAELELSWDYRSILMHAVSREGPSPSLYAQIQGADEEELVEARFVPEDDTKIEDLFGAFSRGACLNPDDPIDDQEGAGNFYFDVNEVMDGLDEVDDNENGPEADEQNH